MVAKQRDIDALLVCNSSIGDSAFLRALAALSLNAFYVLISAALEPVNK